MPGDTVPPRIVPPIGGTIPAGTVPPGPSPRRAGMPPPESRRRPDPPCLPRWGQATIAPGRLPRRRIARPTWPSGPKPPPLPAQNGAAKAARYQAGYNHAGAIAPATSTRWPMPAARRPALQNRRPAIADRSTARQQPGSMTRWLKPASRCLVGRQVWTPGRNWSSSIPMMSGRVLILRRIRVPSPPPPVFHTTCSIRRVASTWRSYPSCFCCPSCVFYSLG